MIWIFSIPAKKINGEPMENHIYPKSVQHNHLSFVALSSVTKFVEIFSLLPSVISFEVYTVDADVRFLFHIYMGLLKLSIYSIESY